MRNTKQGFTLIELLVVISIIGLLSGIVLVSYEGQTERAELSNAMQWASGVKSALGAYAVGIWRLDSVNGGITPDGSGNGNNGTVVGATLVEGLISNALDFDGNDYVSHTTTGIDPRNGTLEAWVKPDVAYPWGLWQTHDASGWNWADWISMFMYGSGRFYFRMGNGSSCCNNDVTFLYNGIVEPGKWMHLAFTWGGTTMKAYVNGEVVAQRTNAIFQDNVDAGARIGQGLSIGMNGIIDDLKIYTEPLSTIVIQQLYTEGLKKHDSLAQK